MLKLAHSVRPEKLCVRLENSKLEEIARTKSWRQERDSFQTNQLDYAICRRLRRPCEGCQEALCFFQFSPILHVCLVVPKENNCTFLKHPVLLIFPEIEVNLKNCGPEKPTRMITMTELHNGSICNRHVHSCSCSTQIHSTKYRT
jgi:hypothetical protein